MVWELQGAFYLSNNHQRACFVKRRRRRRRSRRRDVLPGVELVDRARVEDVIGGMFEGRVEEEEGEKEQEEK